MENFCMNTNAGLIPFDFEITSIDVANKYSCLCEATYKNIIGYSPYELTIDADEFLQFQHLADELKKGLSEDISLIEAKRLCKELGYIYVNLVSNCWQAFVDSPLIDSEPGRFIVNQMWSVSQFNKSLLPINR